MILFVDADGRYRRCASPRVTVVSETAVEDLVVKVLCNVVAHANSTERKVTARKPLGHSDQIGHDLPMVHREPFSGAAKTRHDFVSNQQNPMPGADFAHSL